MDAWVNVLAVAGIVVIVASVIAQWRWRRRTRSERGDVGYEMPRVHKTVRKGGPVSDDDQLAAVLDVEQHMLSLPNGVAMLLLAGAVTGNAGSSPAGATFRYAVGGFMAASALASYALIGRYVLTARRQGIRPRPLWR